MNFQKILEQYKTDAKFISFEKELEINPDTFILLIKTDIDNLALYISDCIESLDFTIEQINNKNMKFKEFIKVKEIDDDFYNIPAVYCITQIENRKVEIANEFKNIINRKELLADYYFSLLFTYEHTRF